MSKNRKIESIAVKNECHEDWNQMTGNDRVRFCSHCAKNVNDLSTMTHAEAMRLVTKSKGDLCVRYIQNPVDGTPVFARPLYRISRRATIAAGVLGATIAMSGIGLAQNKPAPAIRNDESKSEIVREGDSRRSSKGTVAIKIIDPNGDAIPGATVVLSRSDPASERRADTNDQGIADFMGIDDGEYQIRAEAALFKSRLMVLNVAKGSAVETVEMEPAIQTALVGIIAMPEFEAPLFKAILAEDLPEVRKLLADGADVNATDPTYSEITPIFLAVEAGNAAITELLLEFGANVNARDEINQTPLMRVDLDATSELIEILFKYGAKADLTDRDGNNALIFAAGSTSPEVFRMLLRETSRIDLANSRGRTALMEAAEADLVENVRALIESGADVNLRDDGGDSAWDLTTSEEIEEILESNGAGPGKAL